jgi:hypothetical protein
MRQRRPQPEEAGGAVDGSQHNHYTPFPSVSQALPGPDQAPIVPLLWGWPQVLTAIPASRRTLTRELAAGRMPKPVLYIGRRPYWSPDHIRRWAEGGRP